MKTDKYRGQGFMYLEVFYPHYIMQAGEMEMEMYASRQLCRLVRIIMHKL